jgi:hypothetical protein
MNDYKMYEYACHEGNTARLNEHRNFTLQTRAQEVTSH